MDNSKKSNNGADSENDDSADPNTAWERIRASQIFVEPVVTTARYKFRTAASAECDCTRLVIMSDTHGKHRQVPLAAGDALIHAGDFSKAGETETFKDVSAYFAESGCPEVVSIAGNHDITLDPSFYSRHGRRFHGDELLDCEASRRAMQYGTYLQDSACTLDSGRLSVYGSPWTPAYCNWAFNLPRGQAELRSVWSRIPSQTDILITHGPPLGHGDYTTHAGYTGDADLLHEVQTRVKPRLHVFGHIHEGYGATFDGHTLFVNASCLNARYKCSNQCIVVDLPRDASQPARIVDPKTLLYRMVPPKKQWPEYK